MEIREPRQRTELQSHHGSLLGPHGDPTSCCSCRSRSRPSVSFVRHFESDGRGRQRRQRPEGATAATRPLLCLSSPSPPAPYSGSGYTAQTPLALRACSKAPNGFEFRGDWGKGVRVLWCLCPVLQVAGRRSLTAEGRRCLEVQGCGAKRARLS